MSSRMANRMSQYSICQVECQLVGSLEESIFSQGVAGSGGNAAVCCPFLPHPDVAIIGR
jgi:hypothetical protein